MQSIGYQHCVTVVAGWLKNEKLHHLHSEENSNSVRDLVTLAAQIVQPQPEEGDIRGYWSNPEDQVCAILSGN